MVREAEAFSVNSKGLEAKMVAPPAPPPPSANSSAPGFKTNSSGPNPNHAPAQQTPTSPTARDVVLGVITELRARGHLTGLEIPAAELSEERAPALFERLVAAYMAETGGPRTAIVYPVPPPAIASGQNVELLRLYLAVRSRGGFSTVAKSKSWEAVAMDIDLDASARPEIELMYGNYIAHWEICIRGNEVDQEMVDVRDNEDQSLEPNEDDEIVSLTIDPPPAPPAGQQKRKRGALVGTFNWLRTVAKGPDEPGILKANSGGHVSRVVQLRHQMCANIDCRSWTSWKTLTGTFEWVRNVASSPDEPGVVGEDFGRHFATAVQARRRMFASDEEHGLPSVEITECDVWDDKRAALLSTRGIFCPKVRPCGLADIPQWTGKPSLPDEDPDALRFLGELILTPEINVDLNGGSIGKGGQDDCEGPGSINCVRTRVAEKRAVLKRELGPAAVSKLGLDRMGEDVALTWTWDEQMEFHTTIQQNRSSSKLWEKLLAAFHYKSREDIVSYYYNFYLVRLKAHQNTFAPNSARRGDEPLA